MLNTFGVGQGVDVHAMQADGEAGVMWIGTSVGVVGVDLQGATPRHTFTRADGLPDEDVLSIHIDGQGYKWFGCSRGLTRYKAGEWRQFPDANGLEQSRVYSFKTLTDGKLLIGAKAGLYQFDPETDRISPFAHPLKAGTLPYAIELDREGRIWLGTNHGALTLRGDTWQDPLQPSAGEATATPPQLFDIHRDPADNIWIGSSGSGAGRFNGINWQGYSTQNGLSGNNVYTIVEDEKQNLWFGTEGGISRFDSRGRWRSLDHSSGLPSDEIYTLAAAPDGTIWAGVKGAVARIGQPTLSHH